MPPVCSHSLLGPGPSNSHNSPLCPDLCAGQEKSPPTTLPLQCFSNPELRRLTYWLVPQASPNSAPFSNPIQAAVLPPYHLALFPVLNTVSVWNDHSLMLQIHTALLSHTSQQDGSALTCNSCYAPGPWGHSRKHSRDHDQHIDIPCNSDLENNVTKKN